MPFSTKRVAEDLVAEGEGELEPVGGRVGEVVADEQVVVAPFARVIEVGGGAFPGQCFEAGEGEDAVPAVRRGVLGEDVVRALLEADDAGGILPAVVHALDVPAHAEVQRVARDHVP